MSVKPCILLIAFIVRFLFSIVFFIVISPLYFGLIFITLGVRFCSPLRNASEGWENYHQFLFEEKYLSMNGLKKSMRMWTRSVPGVSIMVALAMCVVAQPADRNASAEQV